MNKIITIKKTVIFLNLSKIKNYSVNSNNFDIIVIGGGIIGTAVSKILKEARPASKIALIEKEATLAKHQSSQNSQVIHAGIYYKPDTLKAKLCVEGLKLIYDYCDSNNIPVRKSGKLIIGKNYLDTVRLKQLYKRALENKVPNVELLNDSNKINEIQPNCNSSTALWSPCTGNVNWKLVTESFAKDFAGNGGQIFLNCKIREVKESWDSEYPIKILDQTKAKVFLSKFLVVCLGLYSGTLLDSHQNASYKNVSLKVHYYLLNSKLNKFIKTNIYAMPHLDMPFLGTHFSPVVSGEVLLGPNAVPTFRLDGYRVVFACREFSVDLNYVQNNILSKNLGLLFLKNIQTCVNQVSERFVCEVRHAALKDCFPMLSKDDIRPGPTAVQAQLITENGEFMEDFLIEMFQGSGISKRTVNCRFIPSPGATCSLAIASMISKELLIRLL